MTALIILNFNNDSDTRNCIESILRHNTAPVKFIVVDNASRPDQLDALRAAMHDLLPGYVYLESAPADKILPEATLLETGENLGYGKGNNAGLALAYRDPEISHVMILNNDILFTEDIIPGMLDKMASLPDCAIISPVLYKRGMQELDYTCARRNITVGGLISDNCLYYINKLLRRKSAASRQCLLNEHSKNLDIIPIELPSGSCMLVDKIYFEQIGSFDPATFLYFEENILYKKIEASGRQNYLSLDHKCIHLGAATTESLPNNKWLLLKSKESERYYVRRYSGAGGAMRCLHSASVAVFRLQYALQKSLNIKLRK